MVTLEGSAEGFVARHAHFGDRALDCPGWMEGEVLSQTRARAQGSPGRVPFDKRHPSLQFMGPRESLRGTIPQPAVAKWSFDSTSAATRIPAVAAVTDTPRRRDGSSY
jgi:hypothetical protein